MGFSNGHLSNSNNRKLSQRPRGRFKSRTDLFRPGGYEKIPLPPDPKSSPTNERQRREAREQRWRRELGIYAGIGVLILIVTYLLADWLLN